VCNHRPPAGPRGSEGSDVGSRERPVAHNEEQFRALYDAHYAQVLAFALRRISQPYAQDVVADTFLVAWRRIESIPAQPLPWLYVLARNALANQRRTLRRQDQLKAQMEGVMPLSSTIHRDHADGIAEADAVETAIRRLGHRDQEILYLIAWEDLKVADAAKVLGCSVTTAKVRLHRARRRLARLLDQDDLESRIRL
jgi:RNA polymerase sigma-70 factor, ECF subfamily